MRNLRHSMKKLILVVAATFSLVAIGSPAFAATAEDLNKDAAEALQLLYKNRLCLR